MIPSHQFTFDHAYFMDTPQETVYKDLGVPILEAALGGYNGTIFAYGQTGSGKTHSITGNIQWKLQLNIYFIQELLNCLVLFLASTKKFLKD